MHFGAFLSQKSKVISIFVSSSRIYDMSLVHVFKIRIKRHKTPVQRHVQCYLTTAPQFNMKKQQNVTVINTMSKHSDYIGGSGDGSETRLNLTTGNCYGGGVEGFSLASGPANLGN